MIREIVTDIDENDFDISQGGQVEIIGWIYQYYNTENKEKAISSPKSHKFRDTEIASVTQIFTPDWIVKYMVQNSLGKVWLKSLIKKGDSREEQQMVDDFGWNYYLPEAKQPDNIVIKLNSVDSSLLDLKPADIRIIDPSMGSGHILVYAFDLLMQIYKSQGFSERDASKLIISNNLYGLDIDTRAFQLSYFSIYMKLRQYNRQALTTSIELNIYDVPETNEINIEDFEVLFNELNDTTVNDIKSLINIFENGNDLGSLISGLDINYERLVSELNGLNRDQLSFEVIPLIKYIKSLANVSSLLSKKYHVVITNPPYMGSSRMNKTLSDFAKKKYPNSKSDLFSMFIERWNKSVIWGGYNCMVTMQSWMFLSSFEKMRTNLLDNYTISSLMHMENNVMGIAFGTAVTIIRNIQMPEFIGTYHQIRTQDAAGKVPSTVPIKGNRYNRTNQANFSKIPGSPVAYWASDKIFLLFQKYDELGKYVSPRQGIATADNNKFLRKWNEVRYTNTFLPFQRAGNYEISSDIKWYPYNKGGSYRKWYGNNDLVINWGNNGNDIKSYKWTNGKQRSVIRNPNYFFKEGITWSAISSNMTSFRYSPVGFLFDQKGPMLFIDREVQYLNYYYLLSLMNSKVVKKLLGILAPTLDFSQGPMSKIPLIIQYNNDLQNYVKSNIDKSKIEWDSFETSWDFKNHPLLNHIADDKQSFSTKLLESSYVCAKIVTTVPFRGHK